MAHWEGSPHCFYICLFLVSKGVVGLLSDCNRAEWGEDGKMKWEEETDLSKCPKLHSEPPAGSFTLERRRKISKHWAQ